MDINHIYTVSELNGSIRSLLENRFPYLSVTGEISNLRKPYSGHIYFTLKDDQGQIKAVLFKMQQRYLEQQPVDGQAVICRGRLSVYEPRGDYQLIIDHIDFHGAGNLQIAFEQLKKKLAAEGLFAEETKKSLPTLPRHITLITSPRGAAVHDFIRIATRRFPKIKLAVYPVAVQGDQAAVEIIKALKHINAEMETDIIVLCRGGGSIEDLQPFNDEQLARSIFGSVLPVVSAVGHEIDFTIADFVSDLRAPTPSAAAELLLPDAAVLSERIKILRNRIIRLTRQQLDRASDRLSLQQQKIGDFSAPLAHLYIRVDQESVSMIRSMETILRIHQERISTIQLRLERQNPNTRLQFSIDRLTALHSRLIRAGNQIIISNAQLLQQQVSLLEVVSPHATLARGYAIVRKKKGLKVVTDSNNIKPGEQAEILLYRGRINVTVENCSRENEELKD
jgi:exodeoxyribonuclease VII large subunit